MWQLDLHLSIQSVPINTGVVNRIPVELDTTLCEKGCHLLAISPGTYTKTIQGYIPVHLILHLLTCF
jgi:hypothetical protein